MDISKVLFTFLKSDSISSSFEDLDVNGDGRINKNNKSTTQNSALANEIQSLINSVDPEVEIANDIIDDTFSSFNQVALNRLQNELKTIAAEIEKKQDEYDKLTEKIESIKEGENTSFLKSQAESLASEIKLLEIDITNLVSSINTLKSEYADKTKLVQTQENVAKSAVSKIESSTQKETASSVEETSETSNATTLDTENSTTQTNTTSQTSDSQNDALYIDGKGTNIAKLADLIADIAKKTKTDKTLNEQYNNRYKYKQVQNTRTRYSFAVEYLLKNGTEEQKNAIRSLFNADSSDKNIINSLTNAFMVTKNGRETGSSKDKFIKEYSSFDSNGDGFLTRSEKKEGSAATREGRGDKIGRYYLTNKGEISPSSMSVSSDNAWDGVESRPDGSIVNVNRQSTTTINGVKTYNIDCEIPTEVAAISKAHFDLSISQSELEKLNEYFCTAGETATLDGALQAIGVTADKQTVSSKREKLQWKGESGLTSTINFRKSLTSGELLNVLKTYVLGLQNGTISENRTY